MRWMLVLPLALAACARDEPPAVQACHSRANDDPVVRHLLAASAGSETFAKDHYAALRDARHSATLACLRRRGLAAPGGVEAPKTHGSVFNGFF